MIRARVTGVGSALPKKILSNADLEKLVETSDEWITTRTGIRERRIVSPGEKFSDLCTLAAEAALKRAKVEANDVDMILVGTISGDMPFPATACLVQHNLGATRAAASDISAACVGFLYGLHFADGLIQSQKAERVLVIGGEILSRYVDWTDRSTCVLFGDGAGAVVLEASDEPGILSSHLHADGRHAAILNTPGHVCGGAVQGDPTLKMDGAAVFKLAVRVLEENAREALAANGLAISDVDAYVAHQANVRIISHVAKKLGIPDSRCVVTVDRHANTSAASVPLALDVAVRDGRVKRGDTVLLQGVGGGFTWGSVLLKY